MVPFITNLSNSTIWTSQFDPVLVNNNIQQGFINKKEDEILKLILMCEDGTG
jgi:hypothetical protein